MGKRNGINHERVGKDIESLSEVIGKRINAIGKASGKNYNELSKLKVHLGKKRIKRSRKRRLKS